MANPVKDGKVWRHRVMINGNRVSGTFQTKAAALAWEAEQRMAGTAKVGDIKTLGDAFDRYAREVSKHKKGARPEGLRLAYMKNFMLDSGRLGDLKLSEVKAPHIAEYRDKRKEMVQGSTVSREMNTLSHVFTIARKEWHWISESPMTDVARPKPSKPRDRRISEAEIEMICMQLGWDLKNPPSKPMLTTQRVALAFLWAIETAMRCGEICALRRQDVVGRVAYVGDSKNDDSRRVPLSQRALEIWGLVPDGFDLKPSQVDALFRKYKARTNIENLRFHDSRHEAITRLARKLQVLDLARMTGHRDIRELMTYYNATAEDIAELL